MRSSSGSRLEAVDRAEEAQVLLDREIEVERELLAHVAEPVLPALGVACVTSRPPKPVMRPAVGASRPASMRIVVDLPEPFGPRKPKTPPRGMSKLTLSHGGEVAEPAGDVAHRDDRVGAHAAHAARPAASLRSTNTSSSDGAIGSHVDRRATEPARARCADARAQQRRRRRRRGAAHVQRGAEQRHVVDAGDASRSTRSRAARGSRCATSTQRAGRSATRISARVPTSTRRPPSRKPMREAYSASSMYGVDTTIVSPSWCSWCSIFQNSRRDSGSTPVVGSSSSSRSRLREQRRRRARASASCRPTARRRAARGTVPRPTISSRSRRRARSATSRGTLVERRAQPQVLVDREILVEREALRHEAEGAAWRACTRARGRREDAGDEAEERGLAGAVGPISANISPRGDSQRDAGERRRRAEAARQGATSVITAASRSHGTSAGWPGTSGSLQPPIESTFAA